MPIVQANTINTTALAVPDLYVTIVPPQILSLNGVPTDKIGVAGTSTWGPVGIPVIVGTATGYLHNFGPVQNRKFDMGTQVATAIQQGASNFACVRVTDGTDTGGVCSFNFVTPAAWQATHAYTVGQLVALGGKIYFCATAGTSAGSGGPTGTTSGIVDGTVHWNYVTTGSTTQSASVFANYSGSLGAAIQVSLAAGTVANTWTLTIAPPYGFLPEIYANIPAPNPAAFWINLCAAVNNGMSPSRPASAICGASGGGGGNSAGTVAVGATFASGSNQTGSGSLTGMAGGTDGAGGVTAASLVGVDTEPKLGMYALRGQGCSIGVLADCDDLTQATTQIAFGLQEGIYMIGTTPAGDTVTNATGPSGTIATAGITSYAMKMMFGDWVWWFDQWNQTTRLVSPQGFVAGRLANLSPEQSSLNKQLYSIVGTQKGGAVASPQRLKYSPAELAALFQAGLDVITNPVPGGNFFGVRGGFNTSNNTPSLGQSGDNYTRLTNYIAATLAAGMGPYVGMVVNNDLFQRIRASQLSFLQNMLGQGILGWVPDNTGKWVLPFAVQCDAKNNPQSRTSLGYVQSDAKVTYQAINMFFIVNVEGGQTVQVQVTTAPAAGP